MSKIIIMVTGKVLAASVASVPAKVYELEEIYDLQISQGGLHLNIVSVKAS